MHFTQLTEAHELFRARNRRFVEEEIAPLDKAREEAGKV